MMATVRHVTSSSGLRKFQTDGFLFVGGSGNGKLLRNGIFQFLADWLNKS